MAAPQWSPAKARLARWMGSLCLLTLLVEGQVPRERGPVVRVDSTVFGSVMKEATLRCQLAPASSNVTSVSWSVMSNRDRALVAVFERGRRPYYPLEQQPGRLAFRFSDPSEDATLIIRSLTVRDEGTYYCTFDLPQRRAEASTTLIITVPRERGPVVRVDSTVFGSMMDEATLRCQLAPASSNVTSVSWSVMSNGDRALVAVFERGRRPYYPLEQQPGRLAFRFSDPSEDATLIIRSLTIRDGGTYYCTFDLPQRRAEASTTLIITVTPINSAHAVPASGSTHGLAVVAICTSARGLPPANIIWRSDLSFVVNTTEMVNTDGTVTVQSKLLMKPTIQANNQTATCMISNKPGAVEESIEVVLSINCEIPPSFHRTPVWEPMVSVWVCVALLVVMAFVGFAIIYSQCPRTKASPPDELYVRSSLQDTALEICTTKL